MRNQKGELLGAGLLGEAYNSAEARRFPLEVLPEALREYVEQQARALCVPVDYVAGPLLAALGGTIGRSRTLRIKPGYEVSTALWLVVVGGSGSAKTPALKKAVSFIRDLDKDDDRIVISDTTTEALVNVMQKHPRGLILVIDEMSGWARSFNRYRGGLGSDEQAFLSMWSGEAVIVDRKTEEQTIRVPKSYLAITGTIQPEPLKELFNKKRIESGMASRILVCWPERINRHYTEDVVDLEVERRLQGLFQQLRRLTGEKVLKFSPRAQKEWRNEVSAHFEEINSGELPAELEATWSKLEEYAGRLILILHVVRQTFGAAEDEVSPETVEAGWKLVRHFKAQAWKTYHELVAIKLVHRNLTPLESLKVWLNRHPEKSEIAPRDVLAAKISGIDNAETAKGLLDQLAQNGQGKWSPDGKKYLPNPYPAPSNPANGGAEKKRKKLENNA